MDYFWFTDKYFTNDPIKIFNNGDFTYIDDIVEGIEQLLSTPPIGEVQHKVFNIGNNNPEKLMTFIGALEGALSKALNRDVEYDKVYEPIKLGDVPVTYASVDLLQNAVGFIPRDINQGRVTIVCGLVCGVLWEEVKGD